MTRPEPRRCFLSSLLFPRAQVRPKPPLQIAGSRTRTRSRRNFFFNTRTSEPLPACAHSPHHLRTYAGTVLRNLPSVQCFVSTQVLQHALIAAPRRSNAHSGLAQAAFGEYRGFENKEKISTKFLLQQPSTCTSLNPSWLARFLPTTYAHIPDQCYVTCLLCSTLSLLRYFNTP